MFALHFKHPNVFPLVKKSSLPPNDLNSFRSSFNPTFISKVLEKAVSCRFNVHINCNHLSNVFQSAYKQFHSTETDLLKVHNDVALNMDTGKFT